VIIGMKYRIVARTFPNWVGAAADIETYSHPELSDEYFYYFLLTRCFCLSNYYLIGGALFCSLWNWRVVLKPYALAVAPFYLLHCAVQVVNRTLLWANNLCSWLLNWSFVAQGLSILFGAIASGCITEHLTDQPGLAAMFSLLLFLCIFVSVVYDFALWDEVVRSDDYVKMVIGSVINPLVWELLLFFARAMSRTLTHAHESTIIGPVTIVMALKKMSGRFIIGLISDPSLILASSVILGTWEVLACASLSVRDRMFYWQCCGGCLPDDFDPYAAMKKVRLLRVRAAHMETVLENLFIILSSAVVLCAWDIATEGDGKSPSAGLLVGNIAIQIVTEYGVDYCNCAWLTVVCKQPMLAVSHLNYQGWTTFMCFLLFFAGVFMCDNVITSVIGRNKNTNHEATWVFITPDRFDVDALDNHYENMTSHCDF